MTITIGCKTVEEAIKTARPLCSKRPRVECRKDKYGQDVRLVCRCGTRTSWHTERWKADAAFYQLEHIGVAP